MSLNVLCPACGKTMSVPENYAGRRVKCPSCASVIQIPGAIVAKVVRPSAPEPLDDLLDESLAQGPALSKPGLPKPAARPKPLAPRPARPVLPRRRYEGAASAETLFQFVAFVVGVSLLLAAVLCKVSPGWAGVVIVLSVVFAMAVQFGAVVWAWVVAAQESVLCLVAMFVPVFNLFYMAFYTITRWDRMKGPFLFWALATGQFWGIVLIVHFFGPEGKAVMPWSAAPSQVTAESDPGAAPVDDGRLFVRATSARSPAARSPSAISPGAGSMRRPSLATVPKSSVAWSVKPDPPPEPSESPGKFFDSPIPIGTPAFVRDRAYAAPSVGRAVVLHSREGVSFTSSGGPRFPRGGHFGPSFPRSQKREDCWLTWHDLAKGRLIERLSLDFNARLLALSPQGDVALLRPEPSDGRLIGWSLRDNKSAFEWRPSGGATATGFGQGPLRDTQFRADFTDDEHVLVFNGQNNELSLWRVPRGQAVYRKNVNPGAEPNLSPGRRYVAMRDSRSVQFLDAATGGLKGELLFPEGVSSRPVGHMPHASRAFQESLGETGPRSRDAFSPDGKRFAASIRSADGGDVLCYWDLASGSPAAEIPLGRGAGEPCWCDAGRLLVRGGDDHGMETLLVDADRRAVAWRYDLQNAGPFEFCRDGQLWMLFTSEKRNMDYLAPLPRVSDEVVAKLNESLPEGGRPAVGRDAKLSLKVGPVDAPELGAGFFDEVEKHLRDELEHAGAKILPDERISLAVRCEPGESETIAYGVGNSRFAASSSLSPQRTFSATATPYRCSLAILDGEQVLWEVSITAGSVPAEAIELSEGQDAEALVRQRGLEARKEAARRFFLETPLPKELYCQPRDAEGKLGLGSTLMDVLEEVVVLGNQDLTGLVDAEDLDPQEAPSGEGYEQSSRDYVQTVMVDVLCGDEDLLQERLRWFPKAKRPAVGLRWAFGIELTGEKTTMEIEDAWDVRRITGEIGPFLGRKIEDRIAEGDFGEWPDRGDPRFRQVVILGIAARDKLLESARRQAVDVLIVANVTTKVVGLHRNATTTMRFQFYDVSTEGLLWTSPTLNNTRQSRSADAVAAEVLEQIDRDFCLTAMPDMRPEHAEGRLKTLIASVDQSDPPGKDRRLALLAVLTEARYYQVKSLITAEQTVELYDKILGAGKGRALSEPDEDQRRDAVREWLQTLEPKTRRKSPSTHPSDQEP